MRKLVLALALCAALPAAAATIDVGVNPTSATGHFSNSVGGGAFTDYITFQLVGDSQFITFASATNDYIGPSDQITDFTGQLFQQVGAPGGGDDIPFSDLITAVGCPGNPTGCSILAGSATLAGGNYFLQLLGIGGGTAGYGGNITTSPSPVPIPGALALMGGVLVGGAGMGAWRRRRQKVA